MSVLLGRYVFHRTGPARHKRVGAGESSRPEVAFTVCLY